MKKFIFLSLTALTLNTVFAQADKQENLQNRAVGSFHAITVANGIDLYLSQGTPSVAVGASKAEYRDHIQTTVEDGLLKIYLERGYHAPDGARLRAFVSVSELDRLGASGGSDTYLQNEIVAKDLKIDLSGGSDLKGKLRADELEIRQSGGSDVNLAGPVKSLKIEASGGSDLHGYDLVADDVSVSASGGSDTYFTANHALTVSASGGSDVSYKGSALAVNIRSSGGGSVVKKN
ncbi:MAG TPA: head GIN domain-containing protein [Puia sp.]|nr:head GIN domain-containing protein [Puia sp.]